MGLRGLVARDAVHRIDPRRDRRRLRRRRSAADPHPPPDLAPGRAGRHRLDPGGHRGPGAPEERRHVPPGRRRRRDHRAHGGPAGRDARGRPESDPARDR